MTTELLTDEEILIKKVWLSEAFENGYGNQKDHIYTQKALNTIEHPQQQLAQRDEQIAVLRGVFGDFFNQSPPIRLGQNFYGFMSDLEGRAKKVWQDTQAAAEAHNVKQQAIGREAGIEETLKELANLRSYQVYPPVIDELRSLLSKEPG